MDVASKLESFFNSIVVDLDVLSVTVVGTDTELVVVNSYHARGNLKILLDGSIETRIVSADPYQNTITVQGAYSTVSSATLPTPMFIGGTPRLTALELTGMDNDDKYPFIWLGEPLKEEIPNAENSYYGLLGININLFFADNSNYREDSTEAHKRNVIDPLKKLIFGIVIPSMNNWICFDRVENIKLNTPLINWGATYSVTRGQEKKLFNEHLDAVQMILPEIKFKNCKNC